MQRYIFITNMSNFGGTNNSEGEIQMAFFTSPMCVADFYFSKVRPWTYRSYPLGVRAGVTK